MAVPGTACGRCPARGVRRAPGGGSTTGLCAGFASQLAPTPPHKDDGARCRLPQRATCCTGPDRHLAPPAPPPSRATLCSARTPASICIAKDEQGRRLHSSRVRQRRGSAGGGGRGWSHGWQLPLAATTAPASTCHTGVGTSASAGHSPPLLPPTLPVCGGAAASTGMHAPAHARWGGAAGQACAGEIRRWAAWRQELL